MKSTMDISSPSDIVHKTDQNIVDDTSEILSLQASNENQWESRSKEKLSDSTDHQESSMTGRLFGFFKNVTSPWSETPAAARSTNDWKNPISSEEPFTEQTMPTSLLIEHLPQMIKIRLREIISDFPDRFSNSTEDILQVLDQLILIIEKFQKQSKELEK